MTISTSENQRLASHRKRGGISELSTQLVFVGQLYIREAASFYGFTTYIYLSRLVVLVVSLALNVVTSFYQLPTRFHSPLGSSLGLGLFINRNGFLIFPYAWISRWFLFLFQLTHPFIGITPRWRIKDDRTTRGAETIRVTNWSFFRGFSTNHVLD